ncbi:MAG: hypothetical protein KGL53_07325 [Elusimicrobia bacterium]|nr:hypothetical protein [Elusimicrobiota bacterium]
MKKTNGSVAAMAAVLALGMLAPAFADSSDPYDGLDAATAARLKQWDVGPDTIDVSKYPEEMQHLYVKFAFKCSKCHTLARPINSTYALPQEWQDYVTLMSQKPRSGIHKKDVEAIVKFLVYDSSVRKADLIKQKLAAQKGEGQDGKAPEKPATTGETAPAK